MQLDTATSTLAHMSRQQRRAMERRASKEVRRQNHKPLEPYHNRVRFHELARGAYRLVCQRLMDYGNELSRAHMDGLLFQAGVFTLKAQGKLRRVLIPSTAKGATFGVILERLVEPPGGQGFRLGGIQNGVAVQGVARGLEKPVDLRANFLVTALRLLVILRAEAALDLTFTVERGAKLARNYASVVINPGPWVAE